MVARKNVEHDNYTVPALNAKLPKIRLQMPVTLLFGWNRLLGHRNTVKHETQYIANMNLMSPK